MAEQARLSSRRQVEAVSANSHKKLNCNTSDNKKTISDCLPQDLLKKMAADILEHTKQLGLFDELRMRLLEGIESSKEFHRLKGDFKREVDLFCAKADLGLPRAKLRAKLNAETLTKSADNLRAQVRQIAREHRIELRKLYNNQASKFISANTKLVERTGEEDLEQTTNQVEDEVLTPDRERAARKEVAERRRRKRSSSSSSRQVTLAEEAPLSASSSSSGSTNAESSTDSGVFSASPVQVSSSGSSWLQRRRASPGLKLPAILVSGMITDPQVLCEIPLPASPTPEVEQANEDKRVPLEKSINKLSKRLKGIEEGDEEKRFNQRNSTSNQRRSPARSTLTSPSDASRSERGAGRRSGGRSRRNSRDRDLSRDRDKRRKRERAINHQVAGLKQGNGFS